MSAIGGLSTNLLKGMCTSDLRYLLSVSAQNIVFENNLGEATPIDILGLLLGHLDPTLSKSFLEELDATLIANTRILLLEGVNPNYNAINSLETVKVLIESILPFYEQSESVVYEKLQSAYEKADKMVNYIKKYIMLEVEGDTPQDKEYAVLEDFAKNSTVVKELSTIYTPAVARVYNFRLDAKKSFKYENPMTGEVQTLKHSFVIPQDFSSVLDMDISLKYITLASSLLEFNSTSGRLKLLYLFTSIERLSVNALTKMLNISVEEARALNLDELRLLMYNTILMVAMHSYADLNPYNKDTLNIPLEHLKNLEDPFSGYNIENFIVHDQNLMNSNNEVVSALVNWWRYYCYYHYVLRTRTDLLGITSELHMQYGYHVLSGYQEQSDGTKKRVVKENPYDEATKFHTLTRFCYQMYLDSHSKGISIPSAQTCNILVNEMIKALAEGQYGERKEINYNNTIIKPADVIINKLTQDVESLKDRVNNAINTAVANEELSEETYQSLSSILPWVNVVETILTTKDLDLVPQYTNEWACCNTLGLDMNAICMDRNAMLYAKKVISSVYEKNQYRIDVFNDKNLGIFEGMTVYSQSKAREPETLLNFAVTTTPEGEKIPNLEFTHKYVSTALKEVKYVTEVLTKRLEVITTYEDDYVNSDFKPIKEIYKSMITSLIVGLDESSTVITDALTFHYGHSELNKNLKEFKQRESKIEPIKIEQSRTKSMLESTIDRHKNWYLKLEAREFMLSCLLNANLSPEYMKMPIW